MAMRPVLHLITRRPRCELLPMPHPQQSIASDALLRGSREILIRHGGEIYRLRHTRNDKLILTK